MLVVKNCSTMGENGVFANIQELREWHSEENFPFIKVIDTEKHTTLVGKEIEHKKEFMRVKVPFSTNPSGYITIPSEHIAVNGVEYTVNQFFKEFQFTNEEETNRID